MAASLQEQFTLTEEICSWKFSVTWTLLFQCYSPSAPSHLNLQNLEQRFFSKIELPNDQPSQDCLRGSLSVWQYVSVCVSVHVTSTDFWRKE